MFSIMINDAKNVLQIIIGNLGSGINMKRLIIILLCDPFGVQCGGMKVDFQKFCWSGSQLYMFRSEVVK